MRKEFDDLVPGDCVGDMHDFAEIAKRFHIHAHHSWHDTPELVKTFSFPNKELRVLGRSVGLEHEDALVCGYNYDRIRSGIVVLGRKE